MNDRADHLRELELGENATPDQVRQAYRDLARVWHPDRFDNDPRMQAKASEKLRRVIEAYEFLQAHPRADAPPRRESPRAEPQSRRRSTTPPASSRREEVAQALANLQYKARALDQRINELDRRALAEWEPWAWAGLGTGIALPFAALFLLPRQLGLATGTSLWSISGACSVALLFLALYRFGRIREETNDAIRAIGIADVTCGRCGRGVVGPISPATAALALTRTKWALEHLKCPHCRRAFV